MKKTVLFVLLVTILIVAFASTAYAAVWNFEKSYRTGSGAGRAYPKAYQSGTAGRGYMYTNGSSTRATYFGAPAFASNESSANFVYMQWWAVDPADPRQPANGAVIVKPTANTGSPHGGYTLNSVKCAVCHAVHTAAPAQSAAAPVADTLLRSKASDACGYCHVSEGNTVMDPVYGGVMPIPAEAGHALGTPMCTECHVNVHGFGAETIPPLNGKLLTLATDYAPSTVISRVTAIEASAAAQGFPAHVTGFSVAEYESQVEFEAHPEMEMQAIGLFCGGCHEGSYAGTIAGASASTALGVRSGEFTGHRTMAAATTTWNSFGNKVSSSVASSTKVADAPASGCTSCHDAENGFGTGTKAFPHNWGTVTGEMLVYDAGLAEFENQTFAWLLKASDSSRSDETTSGGVTGKSAHVGANGGTLSDGVCLKCHRWSSGTAGVGLSY
jgi:hypothetical protein